MRVLFCGSGRFAVQPLRGVLAGEHELAAVITQPARPAGRGGKPRPTPIAQVADELHLAVTATDDINAAPALADLREARPDVICVVDFGQFISQDVCTAAPLGAFNLHASLLPELRGAAPINWAIIRGCRRTGVTTLMLAERIDAGDIYAQEVTDISPEETAEELRQRLSELGAGLVCQTLDLLASGRAQGRAQDETKATHAPRLKKADGRVDFSADAETVRNRIHGTWPWPGGQAIFQRRDGRDVPVILARAAVQEGACDAECGTLNGALLVATGGGWLEIKQIKPAGKRLMTWRDFINGYRVKEGDHFVAVDS